MAYRLAEDRDLSTRHIQTVTGLRRQVVTDIVRDVRSPRGSVEKRMEAVIRRAIYTPTKYQRRKLEAPSMAPRRPSFKPPISRMRRIKGETPRAFNARVARVTADWRKQWSDWQALYTPTWAAREELIRKGAMPGTRDKSYEPFRERALGRNPRAKRR